MDKHLLDCLELLNGKAINAVMNRELSGLPFAAYTNDAHALFSGFRAIAELLHVDLMRQDDDDEEDRRLRNYQIGALLGLIRAASSVMVQQGYELTEWIDEQSAKGGQS